MNISSVIFDLGNVIVDLDIPRAEEAFGHLGLTFEDANGEDLQHFLDLECGRISEELFLNHFIKRGRRGIQAKDVLDAWNSMLVDIPLNRLKLIERVKQRYNTFILSNTNSIHMKWVEAFLRKKYDLSHLDQFVDQAFYSHEMGCRKPEPEIYKRVLAGADLDPKTTLFFDDRLDNIEAAQAQGMRGILIDPKDEIIEVCQHHLTL